MSVPGIAVPGTTVPVSSLVSPGGAQGLGGLNSYSTTTGTFTVPAVGSTATVTLVDTSWVTVGESVYMAGAGGSGQGAALQVTAISGNQLTLLNPTPPPALPPPASTSTAGLLNQLSGAATDYVGGDNACHPMAQVQGAFVAKTAAYAVLAPGDTGKYFICSGGSWTLTLPAGAQSGFWIRARNDMGITGTTGLITITPSSGTIDGLASQTLCAGQDCTIITDGTNWRTFGRQRNVVIGTLDISAAVASVTILLPAGYRLFILDLNPLMSSADAPTLQMLLSSDGGNTFPAGYYSSIIYNGASTPGGSAQANLGYGYAGGMTANALGGSLQIKLYPGSNARAASWLSHSHGYYNGGAYDQEILAGGALGLATYAVINAVKLMPSTGTITIMSLTVTGVV